MSIEPVEAPRFLIKQPANLSARVGWLRDYYFEGVKRKWNNEFTSWTTGTPWDFQYNELTFYIVPETYAFFDTFRSAFAQTAKPVRLHPDFWKWSLPERRAWFVKEVLVNYLPQEMLPGDLLAGARFNVLTSGCLNKREAAEHDRMVSGKHGAREAVLWFHNHGYGNAGATSGHLIPDYPSVLQRGWKGIAQEIDHYRESLSPQERQGRRGAQLRAMRTAATMSREVAAKYSQLCAELALHEPEFEAQGRAGRAGGDAAQNSLGTGRNFLGGSSISLAEPYAGHG